MRVPPVTGEGEGPVLWHGRNTSLPMVEIKPWHITLRQSIGFINREDREIWIIECALCPDAAFSVSMTFEAAARGATAHTLTKHMPETWRANDPMAWVIPTIMSVVVPTENYGHTVHTVHSYRQVAPPF